MDLEGLQTPVPAASLTNENLHRFLDQSDHDRILTESRIYDGNHNEVGEVRGNVNFNSFTVVHLGEWITEFKSLRRRAGQLHVIPKLKDRISAVQAEIEDLGDILDRAKNDVDMEQLDIIKKSLDETLLHAAEQIRSVEERDNEDQRHLAESTAFSETVAELTRRQQDLIVFGWMNLSEIELDQKVKTYLAGRSEKSVVSEEVLTDLHQDTASWIRVRADMIDMGFPGELLDTRKHKIIASLQKHKDHDSTRSAADTQQLAHDYNETEDTLHTEQASNEVDRKVPYPNPMEPPPIEEVLTEGSRASLLAQLKYDESPTLLPDLANQGRVGAVRFLLESGADPNTKDVKDWAAIHFAAMLGSESMLQSLIEYGAEPDICNDREQTPIYIAARFSKPRIVKLLLELGVNISLADCEKLTPLHEASRGGDIDSLKLLHEADKSLINNETTVGNTALTLAAAQGHYAVVLYLLQQGALTEPSLPKNISALWSASESGFWRITELLVKYKADIEHKNPYTHHTILLQAALRGRTKVVDILIKKGAKINLLSKWNDTILHLAATGGSLDTVRLLVNQKVAIDAKNNQHRTALHRACYNGRIQIVRFLISKGANISARGTDGTTPLIDAAWRGHLHVVDYLLRYGANVMDGDDYQQTPLHMAAAYNHVSIIKRLIMSEADIEAQTFYNLTPLHLAAGGGHLEATQELLKHGADSTKVDRNGDRPLERAIRVGAGSVIALLKGGTREGLETSNQTSGTVVAGSASTISSKRRKVSTDGSISVDFMHRVAPRPQTEIVLKKATYDFYAEHKDELSFCKGQVLMIVQENEEMAERGWCKARIKGKDAVGLVPIEYLGPTTSRSSRMASKPD